MMLLLVAMCVFYGDLIIKYSNINILSNVIGFSFGFLFCFADPGENRNLTVNNILVILLMSGLLAIIIVMFFFHSNFGMIEV